MNTWRKDLKFILPAFLIWRISLYGIELVSRGWWQPQFLFLMSHWANFDGLQYIVIATQGYLQYQQAYFPLYPILIALVHILNPGFPPVTTALIISHLAFFAGLLCFYRFARQYGEDVARWATLLLLTFPMSYYFASAYTESLFFCLVAAFLLLCRNKYFLWAAVIGMFASATRLVGILLLPYLVWEMWRDGRKWGMSVALLAPLGLAAYMVFLLYTTGDPLAFIHVQPYFGAHRTGGTIVLLPQVLWRYFKILTSVSPRTFSYWVAVSELAALFYGAYVILRALLKREFVALSIYCAAVLLLPTLTGTLSSLPRYILSAFPLFIVTAKLHNDRIKIAMFAIGAVGLTVATSFYLSGYFIS